LNKLSCNGLIGSSFIEKIYNNGLINKKLIGIWIGGNNSLLNDRMMHIGDIDNKYYSKSTNNHKTLQSLTATNWILPLQSITYGKYKLTCDTDFAILDYLHYFTLTSEENFNILISYIKNYLPYTKTIKYNNNIFAYTNCSNTYPDLLITLTEATYRLNPEDYLAPFYLDNRKYYMLAIAASSQKSAHLWSIGNHLLKNYYVVLNPVNQTITFAV